ncbi:MAG: tRNA (guanine-N7)-methyltransferase, partial [Thermodesulfovibrionaceae bacterium]
QLLEFTVKEALALRCFSINTTKLEIVEPETKYEKKWLSIGKTIYDLVLIKQKEPESIDIKEIREVERLFPIKVPTKDFNINKLIYKEFKIREGLYLKFFSFWGKGSDYALETLVSENGFLQTFFTILKIKNDYYIVDVSPFSEILKTEGIQEVLKFIGSSLTEII